MGFCARFGAEDQGCWSVAGSTGLRPFSLVRRSLSRPKPSQKTMQVRPKVRGLRRWRRLLIAEVVAANWTWILLGGYIASLRPHPREARSCCKREARSSAYRGASKSTHASRNRQGFDVVVNSPSAASEMHASRNSAFLRTPPSLFADKRLPSMARNSEALSSSREWKRKCS